MVKRVSWPFLLGSNKLTILSKLSTSRHFTLLFSMLNSKVNYLSLLCCLLYIVVFFTFHTLLFIIKREVGQNAEFLELLVIQIVSIIFRRKGTNNLSTMSKQLETCVMKTKQD